MTTVHLVAEEFWVEIWYRPTSKPRLAIGNVADWNATRLVWIRTPTKGIAETLRRIQRLDRFSTVIAGLNPQRVDHFPSLKAGILPRPQTESTGILSPIGDTGTTGRGWHTGPYDKLLY